MNVEMLREFLGWCVVIDIGILLFSTVFLGLCRGWASRFHAKIFGLDEAWVRQSYFSYLANYKIAVMVLNFVPWIALKLLQKMP